MATNTVFCNVCNGSFTGPGNTPQFYWDSTEIIFSQVIYLLKVVKLILHLICIYIVQHIKTGIHQDCFCDIHEISRVVFDMLIGNSDNQGASARKKSLSKCLYESELMFFQTLLGIFELAKDVKCSKFSFKILWSFSVCTPGPHYYGRIICHSVSNF